jgi:hypothetical protein
MRQNWGETHFFAFPLLNPLIEKQGKKAASGHLFGMHFSACQSCKEP